MRKPSPCQLAAVRFSKKLIVQSIYVSGAVFHGFGIPRNIWYNRSDINEYQSMYEQTPAPKLMVFNPLWPPQIFRLQHIHIHIPLAFLMNYAIMLSSNCVRFSKQQSSKFSCFRTLESLTLTSGLPGSKPCSRSSTVSPPQFLDTKMYGEKSLFSKPMGNGG